MRPPRVATALLALLSVAVTGARAERVQEHPLQGFACLSLNLTPEQMRDDAITVPVFAEPRPDARRIGVAPAGVLAPLPLQVAGGYTKVVRADRSEGWVRSDLLRPYPGRCAPTQLSNGRIGF